MNAKLIGFAVALALLGSTHLFVGQPFGRDSVYVNPSATYYSSKSSTAAAAIRPGRSSVYASDVAAPRPATAVANTAIVKPGRA